MSKGQCVLCISEYPMRELRIECPLQDHTVCEECLISWVTFRLAEGKAMTCPVVEACRHQYTDDQLHILLTPDQFRRYDDSRLRAVLESNKGDYVACPWQGCPQFFFRDRFTAGTQAQCPTCSFNFCVRCLGLYHYNCRCDDVATHRLRWIEWVRNGRDAHLAELNKYESALQDYNTQRNAYDQRRREILSKFDIYKTDEEYKANTCRHCPGCNRLVEKMDGCDSMRCGSDFHTRNMKHVNVQDGCGLSFNWLDAKKYTAEELTGERPEIEEFARQAPEKARSAYHGVFCSKCSKDIVGIRFECVHCRDYNLCDRCDAVVTHDPLHVFKLHTTGLLTCINPATTINIGVEGRPGRAYV